MDPALPSEPLTASIPPESRSVAGAMLVTFPETLSVEPAPTFSVPACATRLSTPTLVGLEVLSSVSVCPAELRIAL